MKRTHIIAVAAVAAGTLAGGAVAFAGGNGGPTTARPDDGQDLPAQARTPHAPGRAAPQGAASGALNEVDVEQRAGRLVYNVDVGGKDIKVDASSGQVVAVDADD